MQTLGKVHERYDDWVNAVLGIGGTRDASTYTDITYRAHRTPEQLEALYIQDHFAAKIVEALPAEAMRPRWDLALPGDPQESAEAREAFAARESELEVLQHFLFGAWWGRLFGGAVTWIGADDGGKASDPLDLDAIKSVRFLHTFDARDVTIGARYSDPDEPKFQQPATYLIRPRHTVYASALAGGLGALTGRGGAGVGGTEVHETRLLVWPGQPTTETRRIELLGWDDSVLERCWDALRQVAEDFGGKSLLLNRISQAVYKIKNLYALISGNQEETLRKRLALLDFSRSRARAITLDLEEDFVNVTQPVSGIDLLLDRSILRLASAADMPVSVLMGQALSGGPNANGSNELEAWHTRVACWRELVLRPRHERLTEIILRADDGPLPGEAPENWELKYRALREPSRAEMANTRKVEADTYKIYIDTGLAVAEEIAVQKFSPSAGGDLVLDDKELQEKLKRRRDLANQPPKDNAELGTVGARATAAMDVITKVATGEISRESGLEILVQFFRLKPEDAEKMLGPKDFEPEPAPGDPTPGPEGGPPAPGGAGRPPQLPGVNTGGDPTKRGTETEPDAGGA